MVLVVAVVVAVAVNGAVIVVDVAVVAAVVVAAVVVVVVVVDITLVDLVVLDVLLASKRAGKQDINTTAQRPANQITRPGGMRAAFKSAAPWRGVLDEIA